MSKHLNENNDILIFGGKENEALFKALNFVVNAYKYKDEFVVDTFKRNLQNEDSVFYIGYFNNHKKAIATIFHIAHDINVLKLFAKAVKEVREETYLCDVNFLTIFKKDKEEKKEEKDNESVRLG